MGPRIEECLIRRATPMCWVTALGKPSSGDDEKGEQATRAAFELPAGEWIVWAAAIGIADYAVYQLYRAATETLACSGLLGPVRIETT